MLIIITTLQQPWWCPMCGGAAGWGWGMVGMMFFWLIALVAIVALVWRLLGGAGNIGGTPSGRAEDILKERYARGEIDRDTYARMLEDLRRGPGA